MNLPIIQNGPSENTKNKFYISYIEEYKNQKFHRYLHPTGWKNCCYYWDNTDDLTLCFDIYKQETLPVTETEYQNRIDDTELWEFEKHCFEPLDNYIDDMVEDWIDEYCDY